MSKHRFFRRHPGEGTPMILAIVLVLLMLFCTVAEFSRVWIIAQGVKEAAQQAVSLERKFLSWRGLFCLSVIVWIGPPTEPAQWA